MDVQAYILMEEHFDGPWKANVRPISQFIADIANNRIGSLQSGFLFDFNVFYKSNIDYIIG